MNEQISEEGVLFEAAPQLKGHVTPRDLLKGIGSMMIGISYAEIVSTEPGYLFKFESSDYHLEIGFMESSVYILRNEQRLVKILEPSSKQSGIMSCCFTWEPTRLSITVLDKDYTEAVSQLDDAEQKLAEFRARTVELITPTTLPPASMLKWARKRAILPATVYETPGQLCEAVAETIVTTAD